MRHTQRKLEIEEHAVLEPSGVNNSGYAAETAGLSPAPSKGGKKDGHDIVVKSGLQVQPGL
jgi:hypothetical protein